MDGHFSQDPIRNRSQGLSGRLEKILTGRDRDLRLISLDHALIGL